MHTATLLPNGKVLFAGGTASAGNPYIAAAELFDPASDTWKATGPLIVGRQGHTATLLPTGKVLIAGGDTAAGLTSSSELYDPAAGTWTPTGSLMIARVAHTATLLKDGRVLVAGGIAGGETNSAELYDPASGTWTLTGPLVTPHYSHTATQLPDGKVIVIGGGDALLVNMFAELYDPSSGSWTIAASLIDGHYNHTATLLDNGKVLVAGGGWMNWLGSQDSTELYDPATGTFTRTGYLTVTRENHSATLLPNGQVVVIGGAGGAAGDALASAERYDPSSGTWTPIASMAAARQMHTTTLLPDGDVLVAGGYAATYLASAERYRVVEGSWSPTGPLATGRSNHSMTLLSNGKVLAAGGAAGTAYLTSSELYDPGTRSWSATGPLAVARSGHRAITLPSGKVLVAGGLTTSGAATASVELYDPETGSWSTTGSMLSARQLHSATLLPNGKVLVVGGQNVSYLSSAELYDPATGTWTATGSLATSRCSHTSTLLTDGHVLVVGGYYGDVRASAELYDPSTGTWTEVGSLNEARSSHSATLIGGGRVLVAGGYNGTWLRSAEIYDPSTQTWTTAGSLSMARVAHTAALLPDGRVLVVAGYGGPDPYFPDDLASAEVFDPHARTWSDVGSIGIPRTSHASTILRDGTILVTGGFGPLADSEIYDTNRSLRPMPMISSVTAPIAYGTPVVASGTNLGGGPETHGGSGNASAVNYPLFEMRSVENDHVAWLVPDSAAAFTSNTTTVTFTNLPTDLDPGWHFLTPVRSGIRGESRLVNVSCSVVIATEPADATVAIGERALFSVVAYGGRHFRWEKNFGSGWQAVGSDQPSYMTEPISGADVGTRYRVHVDGPCSTVTSIEAVVMVVDHIFPTGTVVSPSGGEFWLLSSASGANSRLITWSMSDNVRVCQAVVSLRYSEDGGVTYLPAPSGGGLPSTFGSGGSCLYPGVTTSNATYTIPTAFPSGRSGSLYKIQLVVTDQAGNVTTTTSASPFYIVQANPDAVKTLILANVPRMIVRQGVSGLQANELSGKLQELANHPRVQGLLVDLGGVTSIGSLYDAWDLDPSNPDKANAVLFGSGGIHDYLLTNLLAAYTGVKYIVLVGDDQIIPMARLQDRTALLPEATYVSGGDITGTGTTVGRALAAGKYLSDDPLAVLDPVTPGTLDGSTYLPDLAEGRLVETPQEIVTTIATYIGQDGILDLSLLDSSTGHKVLVTGYDFLTNVAARMRTQWKNALGINTPANSIAPVDGSLIGGTWALGSVGARTNALRAALSGNGGSHYGVMAISGHATHYEEGVPGTDPFDIQGLSTADIYGGDSCSTPTLGSLDLAGSVVYAVGCHGGLAVTGSCRSDADHSLDLPQTMLARGVLAYVANSGYGWGLKFGIGYGSRLTQIFTEQLTSGGTLAVGDVVKQAKQRYYLETPRYDAYDEKSVMQWTLYGLPMYAVKTGIAAGSLVGSSGSVARSANATGGLTGESVGPVKVKRQFGPVGAAMLPSYVTQLNLSFDFTGAGVYDKHDSSGTVLAPGAGCPDPNGCYYTLNGLVDRGTGSGDLPIQPYLIYDSRLSGTSQHGVLWKGGTYDEESGWTPVIAQLVSNGGDGSNHGAAPRKIILRPTAPRVVPGVDSPLCRPSDLEVNSITLTAGEAVKPQDSDSVYSVARRYRNVDLEVFYFNNRTTSTDNCDRTGPSIGTGPFAGAYHQFSGSMVNWSVPVTDTSGVWRVIIVYTTNMTDGSGQGAWIPVELTNGGSGIFTGSVNAPGVARLTYVIQAVDNRGNVTWLDYVTAQLPSSGIPLGIPLAVDVPFTGLVGDANGDGALSAADVFYLINFLFGGGPPPIAPGDANGDGIVTVADVFYLINYLFAGGPPPH